MYAKIDVFCANLSYSIFTSMTNIKITHKNRFIQSRTLTHTQTRENLKYTFCMTRTENTEKILKNFVFLP